MLDIYLFECDQLLQNLESLLLECERNKAFTSEQIADIFRILHTIKGSSAMMDFDNIANIAHALEDLFAYLREHDTRKEDFSKIFDLSFITLDNIKAEITKVQNNGLPNGDFTSIIKDIKEFNTVLNQRKDDTVALSGSGGQLTGKAEYSDNSLCFKATAHFKKDCKMENVRALGVIKAVETLCSHIAPSPANLDDNSSADEIIESGFTLHMLSSVSKEEIQKVLQKTFFLESLDFEEVDKSKAAEIFDLSSSDEKEQQKAASTQSGTSAAKQNFMSVNLNKLDLLMDLVGEIVIAQSTVTENPEVKKLHIPSFEKSSRQLHKLTDELQDIVMSIRMVPVASTFRKMERVVRNMINKIDKKANMTIIGEDTELDKNILDNLSDPLMHIIRNAVDHGIEAEEDRIAMQKDPVGKITLEARNTGGEVLIIVSDDGKGLNKDELIQKGISKGLIKKPASEVTDKEAYSLIFAAGFSTKQEVTEFSGRGVGMDAAMKNIQKLGGSVSVNSTLGHGMSVQIRLPLTLAIIDGLQVAVGEQSFIIPLLSIRESFKPQKDDIFSDTDGNKNIYIRGECYPILRLHEAFNVDPNVAEFEDGILVLVESESQAYCIFVDELIGDQQAVVKPIPVYISKILGHKKSIAGCTILGDGSVSLIIDINGLYA